MNIEVFDSLLVLSVEDVDFDLVYILWQGVIKSPDVSEQVVLTGSASTRVKWRLG